jgi:hypothetical protein
MKRGLTVAVIVAVAVVVGVGAFFGGRESAGGSPAAEQASGVNGPTTNQTIINGNGLGNGSGNGVAAMGLTGTIIGKDENSITLKQADGSTKIILYSDSTDISKTTKASLSDLTAGTDIAVMGTSNSDGSFTASSIQIGSPLGAIQRSSGPGDTSSGSSGNGTTNGEQTASTATTQSSR